jgi:hypothetical protein
LRVLVKHVLVGAIAISFSVLDAPLWLAGGDFRGRLFLLYSLLLVSFIFVGPLNKPRLLRFRSLANLLGGILPLASLFLPYAYLGSEPWYLLGPSAVSHGEPHVIIVGSILTFFSSFGMLVTIAGVWNGTYVPTFCPAFACPPLTLGPGYWLGWAGATVSLLGRSWIPLPKSVEGRKIAGSILFPVGLIIAILGGLFASSSFNNLGQTSLLVPVFTIMGFLLTGVGLGLFFRLESTTLARIRRALQKPVW